MEVYILLVLSVGVVGTKFLKMQWAERLMLAGNGPRPNLNLSDPAVACVRGRNPGLLARKCPRVPGQRMNDKARLC